MKIAMIGSGAAGSVFASYLRKGGADITLVDPYREHMEKVAKDGMTFVIYPDETYHLTGFKTALNADDIGIMDVVIFMTKATQAKDALKTAEPCIGENTVLVSLMNGLGNEDILLAKADPQHVMYGSGVIGTALDGPGKCISSPIDGVQMNFGAVENGPATDAVGKHLEKCFNDGGCYAVFQEDVKPLVWRKAIVNSVFNPLSALTRLKVKDILANPHGMATVVGIISEAIKVANADGVPFTVPSFVKELQSEASEGITDYFPSMAQDMLMFRRQTEIDVLNGAIVKRGKKYGIPCPTCDLITKLVTIMQANYDKQYEDDK